MILVTAYKSKKDLKEAIGSRLRFQETSIFGAEYKNDGTFCVANRPHLTGIGREFFASVTMEDGRIAKVS